MKILPVSIGQAGNQVCNELSYKMSNSDNSNYFNNFSNELSSQFMIDSEAKVIGKFNNKYKGFSYNQNLISNSNGRGSNWALGYSIDYKEKGKENLNLECIDKLNTFIEKCDFIQGFNIIHSIYGGTGSGLSSRLIELIRDEYPKSLIVDCPIIGFNTEKTTMSYYNHFLSLSKVYKNVDAIIPLENEFVYKKLDKNEEN